MILSNTPSWYFLQYHQRYSLQYATHATHVSTSLTLPILAHHPRWHVTLACRLRNPRQHVNQTGTLLTLARHQSKHTTHASTPPTHARYPQHLHQYNQHAISRTPRYPIKLLKHFVFIFTVFAFQAFLSVFVEIWKTAIEKLNFFRENQSTVLKRQLFFQKQMSNFFRKRFFLEKTFLYILNLEKQFTKTQYLKILNERKSLIFESSRP